MKRIQLPKSLYGKSYQKMGGGTEFGSHFIKETPDLKPKAGYLRLKWLSDSDGVKLEEVIAVQQTGEPQQKKIWTTIDRMPEADDSNDKITAYEYNSAARMPVDQIRIDFTKKKTLEKVRIFSKPDLESEWRYRQSSFFTILNSTRHPYSRIKFIQDQRLIGTGD